MWQVITNILANSLLQIHNLKMEAGGPTETLITTYQTRRWPNILDRNTIIHCLKKNT